VDRWVLRSGLIATAILLGWSARTPSLHPLDLAGPMAGLLAAVLILGVERILHRLELVVLVGGLAGLLVGGVTAAVVLHVLPDEALPGLPPAALRLFLALLFLYGGLAIGVAHAERFSPESLRAAWTGAARERNYKILDTSAIIDGRIADVCETGFVDGTLVVPQFVLRELQYVADSPDAMKRNRGRKGLEVLQRIKKGPDVQVIFPEQDFPDVKDVDLKLIELARLMSGRIVTNDFNLNKVAELRGVRVLNINMLANSLKPVVLPGESMNIFILKEGKEPNQGVGYLDDGTMVVVDNAKRFLGRNIDITVTSVLQTTAGKMFFGRCENGEDHVAADGRLKKAGA
jgi:uncharacterized protein YacL